MPKNTFANMPKRFLLRVLCNKCGIFGMARIVWGPKETFIFECLTCGEGEILYLNPQKDPNNPDRGITFTKEEAAVIKHLIDKKDREKEPKEPN